MVGSRGVVDTGQQMMMHKEAATMVGLGGGNALGNGHFENWGDSGLADNSQQTDTSTDVDTDDKNQVPSPVFFTSRLNVFCHVLFLLTKFYTVFWFIFVLFFLWPLHVLIRLLDYI